MTKQLELWRGQFGDDYITRNTITEEDLNARKYLWRQLLQPMWDSNTMPNSILEIGAGQGINLLAIDQVCDTLVKKPRLHAVEPNEQARNKLISSNVCLSVLTENLIEKTNSASYDLVFTSGVLIHIHPDDLMKTMKEIYRISKQYIICMEYFSPEQREIKYRDENEALWSNDFGRIYLENFHLQCVAFGFAWKKITGIDDLVWQIFRKVD